MTGQLRDLILERSGEPRVVPGPWDRAHDHAVAPAADPRCVGLQEAEHRPQIQRSPAPATLAQVIAGRAAATHPAAVAPAEPGPDRHDHLPVRARPDVLRDRSAPTEQPSPHPDTASLKSDLRTAGHPRRSAACALCRSRSGAPSVRPHCPTARRAAAVKRRDQPSPSRPHSPLVDRRRRRARGESMAAGAVRSSRGRGRGSAASGCKRARACADARLYVTSA